MARTGIGKGNHANSRKNLKKWQLGQTGNPKGRPPNIKYVSEALRDLLRDPEVANDLAKRLKERAKKSDSALAIVLDRTEGKVTQPISGEGGKPIEVLIDYRGKMLSAISRHANKGGEGEATKETQP